jgi:hypothetical protein
VAVSCLPDSWAACEDGEIPWRGSCYSFFPNSSSFDLAAEACKVRDEGDFKSVFFHDRKIFKSNILLRT